MYYSSAPSLSLIFQQPLVESHGPLGWNIWTDPGSIFGVVYAPSLYWTLRGVVRRNIWNICILYPRTWLRYVKSMIPREQKPVCCPLLHFWMSYHADQGSWRLIDLVPVGLSTNLKVLRCQWVVARPVPARTASTTGTSPRNQGLMLSRGCVEWN